MSDNITLPREVVKLALEALEWSWGGEPMGTLEREAITALRTALASPRLEVTVDPRLTAEEAAAISAAIDARKKEQSEGIEALRRDAERYRWLRDNAAGFSARTLDAITDAALRREDGA